MNQGRIWLAAAIASASFFVPVILSQTKETSKSDEYLILGDANRGAGEPMIAVNRKVPNNILIVAMATLHRLPNGEVPDGLIPPTGPGVGGGVHSGTQRVRELSTQDETVTDIAVSRDRGKTWNFSVDGRFTATAVMTRLRPGRRHVLRLHTAHRFSNWVLPSAKPVWPNTWSGSANAFADLAHLPE